MTRREEPASGLGSVLEWDPLHVFDHQHFNLLIARFQPQP
jgi:hypothetical protein